jgi:hypothetical protein
MSGSQIDLAARSLRRTNSPMLVPQDERERSRSLIGKYYDILDNSYSSDYAGKRQRSEGVSDLFSSLASETRKVNRLNYYKERSIIKQKETDPQDDSEPLKVEVEQAKPVRMPLVYVPPTKQQKKTKKEKPVPEKKRASNSIVLKRKVFDKPGNLPLKHEAPNRMTRTLQGTLTRRAEPEASILKVIPMQADKKPEAIEIVFCPISGKQPLLKFVPENRPDTDSAIRQSTTSSKLSNKRMEAKKKGGTSDRPPSEMDQKKTEAQRPSPQAAPKALQSTYQSVRPVMDQKIAPEPPKEPVPQPVPPQNSPSKPALKSNRTAAAQADPKSIETKKGHQNKNERIEESPESSEVFRIVLPLKTLVQPAPQPQVGLSTNIDQAS